ncbi:hypothetical protein HHK36_025837 [Tetracentron sinense]|uniref:Retrovirus-related Pol polyprotein from transposon TNT 1-94-like beta-barrel domain-containing protein n=1 Tax=Tetracentron sinense TaxID=13715 RepID=A0A834YHM5_TETSI|nr:hypothetical protein HHK36_025837 [Tetracentron sinense]
MNTTPLLPYSSMENMLSIKLNGNNYLLWRNQILPLLESQELLGFIDGTAQQPLATITQEDGTQVINPEHRKWRLTDRFVLSLINSSLTEAAMSMTMDRQNAFEVWTVLEESYAHKSKNREWQLREELQVLKRDSSSISDHVRKFRAICDQLSAIGSPVLDTDKVYWFLRGLGPEYHTFVTTTLSKPPIPSFQEVVPSLLSHELLLRSLSLVPTGHEYAFNVQRGGRHGRNNNRGGGRNYKPNHRNQNYHNSGIGKQQGEHQFVTNPQSNNDNRGGQNYHRSNQPYDDNCGGPNYHRSNQPYDGRNQASANHDQRSLIPGTQPIANDCQICGRGGHTALECRNRFNHSYQTPVAEAFTSLTIQDTQDAEWYPDSGATAHMTNNEGNLSRITSYHGADRVLVGNGSCIPISHTGSVSLNTPTGFFQLNNTLLVPHIKKNLISVSQFTRDNDCQFTFSSSGFVIQARKTGKVLGTGSSKAGLYILDRLHQAFLSSSSVKGSSEIWHNRLGHVAPTTIDVPSSSPPNPAFHQPDPPSIDIVPLNSQVPSTTPAIDPSESISSTSSSLDQLPPSSPSTGSIDLPAPTTSTCSNINDHPDELGASIRQPIPTTRACDIPGGQIIIQLPLAPPNAHPMVTRSKAKNSTKHPLQPRTSSSNSQANLHLFEALLNGIERVYLPEKASNAKIFLNGGQRVSFLRSGGYFSFLMIFDGSDARETFCQYYYFLTRYAYSHNVSAGTHLIEVAAIGYFFSPVGFLSLYFSVRVDVSARNPGKVQAALTENRRGLSKLVLEPLREEQNYEVDKGTFLHNVSREEPNGSNGGLHADCCIFLMPKLVENMDPQEIKRAQEDMRTQGVPSIASLLPGAGRSS